MARVNDDELHELAETLGRKLHARGWMLATAESCTGGWIGEVLTSIPGSSSFYERGFITYANAAKIELLGVPPDTIATYGAVSEETARAMAHGALVRSPVHAALSVSGIAGPGGGTREKPVGTVCYGWALNDGTLMSSTCRLDGDRTEIRSRAVAAALRGMIELVE
ncbi:CinA family protein [Betaproteobacteria bacterium SCN1]|jgi:nicotinamide-nucleotide amidase|nr:CinA family protein [Betaproteobacteria bacterium SCN1]MBN8760270.1 CinA family protein [Thiobacillus sp.]ODU90006.1 MAG: damage-inducible protein CinA [Thiobacillus sp. SCN 65-179]OJW39672.1 MAG: damage-inducible protein CinA [Thiobacillus sp. 65-69]